MRFGSFHDGESEPMSRERETHAAHRVEIIACRLGLMAGQLDMICEAFAPTRANSIAVTSRMLRRYRDTLRAIAHETINGEAPEERDSRQLTLDDLKRPT
jgi:hypothetical protein